LAALGEIAAEVRALSAVGKRWIAGRRTATLIGDACSSAFERGGTLATVDFSPAPVIEQAAFSGRLLA
jgi:hypothetical protein